ncbi:cellulase family glycosylhydrolase [Micromonospora sp. LAH09]|uniref:cellulase family glycosylhydrolase n=1 Tax=Micromonospora cabrerizensis TaxID=2911213 RepID=UPI001EE96C1B|nr:cellulase family glycosylhydrolase [Micromonospora cabrerizensis]MCG5468213.1 cellulase family glycosylhydrolase [Micromonospora cabrerizensis]
MRAPRLVTTLAVAGLLAGGVALAASPASAATAVFAVTNSWGSGYQGQVTVTNDTSAPITSWRVEFDLPSSSTVSQSWNAQQSTSGSRYTFTNVSWNGTLAAGASTSFGFLVNGSGTPVNCTVNGASCAGGPPPTTPPPTTPPPTTPPPTTGTPVERHGQLRVCGTTMCDRTGARVQLRGVSSMWLNWETAPYAENLSALTWMRDTWNLQVIRAAMGVEPAGAYLSDPNKARTQVETIINNAVSAGVYVIVDWHAHEAQNNQSQAVAFFGDLARRYGHLPNVIWEPYNEPLQVSWTSVIKPYHQAVVSAIRAADPDNIVVLGTPTWSQDVDVAAASPVAGTNLMYTLHFYSCTHGAALRAKGDAAIRAGLALFVTEWGASHADGGLDGRSCLPEAQSWIDWMKTNGISWTAWKLDVGTDTTNLLSPGAPVTGGWNNHLHGHAPFVVANMR